MGTYLLTTASLGLDFCIVGKHSALCLFIFVPYCPCDCMQDVLLKILWSLLPRGGFTLWNKTFMNFDNILSMLFLDFMLSGWHYQLIIRLLCVAACTCARFPAGVALSYISLPLSNSRWVQVCMFTCLSRSVGFWLTMVCGLIWRLFTAACSLVLPAKHRMLDIYLVDRSTYITFQKSF